MEPLTRIWIGPDGREIEINTRPENEAMARKLGWVLKIDSSKADRIKVVRNKKDVDQ